jgi:hypothetical protein
MNKFSHFSRDYLRLYTGLNRVALNMMIGHLTRFRDFGSNRLIILRIKMDIA